MSIFKSTEDLVNFAMEENKDITDILKLLNDQCNHNEKLVDYLDEMIYQAEKLYDMRDKYRQIEQIVDEKF